jgi:hypothetical protein
VDVRDHVDRGDDPKSVVQEEHHLRIPVVGGQRPAVGEYDGLATSPVSEKYRRPLLRRDGTYRRASIRVRTLGVRIERFCVGQSKRIGRSDYGDATSITTYPVNSIVYVLPPRMERQAMALQVSQGQSNAAENREWVGRAIEAIIDPGAICYSIDGDARRA